MLVLLTFAEIIVTARTFQKQKYKWKQPHRQLLPIAQNSSKQERTWGYLYCHLLHSLSANIAKQCQRHKHTGPCPFHSTSLLRRSFFILKLGRPFLLNRLLRLVRYCCHLIQPHQKLPLPLRVHPPFRLRLRLGFRSYCLRINQHQLSYSHPQLQMPLLLLRHSLGIPWCMLLIFPLLPHKWNMW